MSLGYIFDRVGDMGANSVKTQRGPVRFLLQYLYSIGVFSSVLATAYVILDKEGNTKVPPRPMAIPSSHVEASAIDPALAELINMESELGRLPFESADKRGNK